MSSAFTSLISKIENYYGDKDYTTQDAEHLSRLAIVEYASQKNALVASARQVSSESVEKVIDIAIKRNLAAQPSEWMVFAANAVDNVLNYSHEGIIASGIGEYTDFLPEGHPSRTNRPAMTASVSARSTALWIAGDPRIASDQARLDVYNAYSTKPGSVEAEYAGAKLSALVSSGYVPEDVILPITAAFKMNFAMRSAIAKALAAVRRRHGDGRFAEEFGRLKGFFSRKNGSIFSSNGRIVGAVPNTNNFEVAFPGDADIPKGVYTLDASRTSSLKAVLSKRALKNVKGLKPTDSIAMPTESEKRMAVSLDEFLATRKDAPSGWTKNEDGSFTSKSGHTSRVVDAAPEGDYMTEGIGEGGKIDPTQPIFELTDKDGKTLGIGQDWAGLNKISMSYDALDGKLDTTTDDEPGFDQSAGEGQNWADSAIDFDHLTDPQNWSQFKDGSAEYTSPDGKLKLNWEPDGEPDMGSGMTDLSGISVEYDGQPVGSFRASQRDLEEGDIEDGLRGLLEKNSWFSPDNLMKTENDGNSYSFETDNGFVGVEKELDPATNKVRFAVSKEASDLIDENREASYSKTDRFDSKADALADAEKFAQTLNDPNKLSNLLNESYMDEPAGFDQKASSKLADDLAKHDFFEDGGSGYVSPDGRVSIDYNQDFEMKDDGAKRASWEDLRVKVDGKYVDSVTRKRDESFEDFTKRAADVAQLGLDNPNYADEKKAKREADRKAREEFEKSPEQVAKREEEKFAREQEKIAQQQARESIDTEGLLGKIDDLAEEIFYNDGGKTGIDFTVGDIDSDGQAKFTVYDADGEEIGYGYFTENDDPGTVADDLLALTNAYLDKKLDELEPPAGLDQKAGTTPAFLEENPDRLGLKPVPIDKLNDPKYRGLKGAEGLYSYEGADGSYGTLESDNGDDDSDKPQPTVYTATLKDKDGNVIAQRSFKENQKTQADSQATEWLLKRIADHNKSENKKSTGGFSAKQMEPATDKQYALLEELNSERDDIDPVTQQAIDDALAGRNMSKAQISSLFGELNKKPFKPGIDPTKPTDRQIDSLQGYLTSKDLSPEEMTDILDQLDAGLDRAGMEALTAKLRRRPDREGGFDQAAGEGYQDGETVDDVANDIRTRGNSIVDQIEELGPVDGESPDEFKERIANLRSNVDGFASTVRSTNQDIVERSGIDPDRSISGDDFDLLYDELDALSSEGVKRRADAAYFPGQPSRYYRSTQDSEDGFDQSAGDSEWTKKLKYTDANGYRIDANPQSADKDIRDRIDAAVEKGVTDGKARLAELEANGEGDSDEAKELKRGIDQFGWAARSSRFKSNNRYMAKEGPFEGPFKEVNDAWEEQVSRSKERSKKNRALADTWYDGADEDVKSAAVDAVEAYLDELAEQDARQFYMGLFEFAKSREDGRRVFEKSWQYVGEYADYLASYDPEQLGLILDDQDFDPSSEDGFDQATTKAPSAKMSEPATEAQYSYLQNLAETKMDIDPETAKAIQEALDSKNLTKSQAGGFIGKLRDLGNKENVGQYGKPSQRMIDSVNRDVYMKGLSDEDREAFLDKLESQSKGDVSAIISRLKDLPDVDGGMEKYIDSLVAKNDPEALQRLLDDERYGRWSSQMKDGLAKMGAEPEGLDQSAGKPSYDFTPEVDSLRDLVDRIAAEDDAEDGDLGTYNFIKKDSLEGIDGEWEAYNLLYEMERLYRDMRPKTEKGKQLEADLGKAVDDLKTSLDAKVGPIEAAKHDPEEGYENYQFDRDVRDLEDFFDYYYPTRATQDMRRGDGGMVGDNRGGGWEAAIFLNEETGKWDAQMTSPGRVDESYAEEFEDQDEAADWIDDQLETQNRRAEDYDTKILAEDGLEGLIKEYGDDPEKLAGIMENISSWLSGTNRGIAEDPARRFGEYAERLRKILADNPKA